MDSKISTKVITTLLCAVALVACAPQSTEQSNSAVQAGSTVVLSRATRAASTPTATPLAPLQAATTTPGASVNATITPRSVTVGNVTLDLSLQPARHMFAEESTVQQNSAPQPTPASGDNNKNQSAGSEVFAGGMVGVTNNIDPSQAPPADTSQSIIRHVVVHVKTKDGGQPVAYLNVTMDLLLDGHPVIYDQALEPMTALDQNPPQFYYGNNVKFPQRGTYQVFVRMQPNPLLGKGQPQAAQFNLTLR